ncbi:MAG: hypothetical protein ABWY04_10465 [Arthrobacter sp.]
MNTAGYTALIIPAESIEPLRLEHLEGLPRDLEHLVGGPVEGIIRGDWHVYLNADGHSSPPNLRATQLLRECGADGHLARGTAVFLGRGKQWEDTDVPEHLVRLAEQHFGFAQAA